MYTLHPYLIHTSAIHHPCLYPCPDTYTSGVFVFQRRINRHIQEAKNPQLPTHRNTSLSYLRRISIDFTHQVTEYQRIYPIQSLFSISNIAPSGLIHIKDMAVFKKIEACQNECPSLTAVERSCKNQSYIERVFKNSRCRFRLRWGQQWRSSRAGVRNKRLKQPTA